MYKMLHAGSAVYSFMYVRALRSKVWHRSAKLRRKRWLLPVSLMCGRVHEYMPLRNFLFTSPRRYGNCGGHKITPRSRLLPVCGSYNNDKISIIIATFIFSSRVSTEMVFEVVTNYSRFTPLLSGIVDKLKYACEDVIEFIYSYNSSICSSDTDSCSDSCPDCQLNSVTYLHSINCTNEVFLFVRTTCANFSIPGACIGLNSPQSSCCLKTPNQDSVTLPSILAPLCILFLITLIAAIALTAYSVKTRYAWIHYRGIWLND